MKSKASIMGFSHNQDLQYTLITERDHYESITPTTNKGHLTNNSMNSFFQLAKEKLEKFEESNKSSKEYYTAISKPTGDDFENQEQLEEFLAQQSTTLDVLKQLISKDKAFINKYQYGDNSVIRFKINTFAPELEEVLSVYNAAVQQKKFKPLSSKDSKNTKKYEEFVKQVIPTELESNILKAAIAHLESTADNSTLIDVFVRDSNGLIENYNSIHTVVIYKNNQSQQEGNQVEYCVIDPSNATFSSFLVNTKLPIKVSYSESNKIYSPPSKELGIEKVGSHSDQWRDCIDIAVKLAFGFSHENPKFDFTTEQKITDSFKQCKTIQCVTNNFQRFNKNLMDEVQEYPVRVRQASNTKISQKSNEQLEYIDRQIKEMMQFKNLNEQNKKYKASIDELRDDVLMRMSVGYKSESYQLALKDYDQLIDSLCGRHKENVQDYELNIIGADKPIINTIEDIGEQ